ncbi:tyrosine-type recombinase/integrase [Hominifimenecus sp. rT4P-3]|uniref:tyrosine-type recombinase/integrase n=1 Tax=Hominifimenecus sp. rT4P-3 TaxID=3242979 RepID=UPI003DA28107
MANITKRGNSYKITVSNGYDITGKQIRESATFTPDPSMTAKQQEKALNKFVIEFEESVKNGKYLDGEKMTVKDFAERWMKEYVNVNLAPRTQEKYSWTLEKVILPQIGHLKLSKVTPLHLTSLYNRLTEDGARMDGKEGGLSPNTIQKYHVMLSGMFKAATQWMILDSNPCQRAVVPKVKQKQEIKFFTDEQALIFLQALDEEYPRTIKGHTRIDDTGKPYQVSDYIEKQSIELQFKVYFYVALYSGARRGEIVSLTWQDIDFSNRLIDINKTASSVKGRVIVKQPKTLTSNRKIVLPDIVLKLLRQHRKEQIEYRFSLGDKWIGEGDYVFTQWNGKMMDPSTPYQKFKRVLELHNKKILADDALSAKQKEENLLPDISLHGLRHTSATLLLSEKMDPVTVANRLGHAKASTTLDIYAHALEKNDKAASDTLDHLLTRKQAR